MSRSGRLAVAAVIIGVGIGLIVFLTAAFMRSSPPTVDFASGHQAGQPVNLNLETVGAIGYGAHPTWVSYLTLSPAGQWVHTTLWDLPADTTINVTINQFDSGSPLRNQLLGLVQGTSGNVMNLNGKSVALINATLGNGVAHTFSIPTLGINVPLAGVNGSASNFCSTPAPCLPPAAHNTVKFSFVTPGPGNYPWQCFIPCGLGYLYGNGGPMQSVGYMDGFLKVVS